MAYPKVLVCAPHARVKNYCINDWLRQVHSLSYPRERMEVFVADNSPDKKNVKWLRSQGVKAEWVRPKNKPNVLYMAMSHERCRQYAIHKKFDYMLHWETDIHNVPPNIIERLLMAKKKVVNALYPIKHGEKSFLMMQYAEPQAEHLLPTVNAEHTDMSFIDGKVKKVFHAGLGLVLIKRSVFKKIPFRCEADKFVHPDTFFSVDLQREGISNWVDTSIILKHNNKSWVEVAGELKM